jgi:hypothetical protein
LIATLVKRYVIVSCLVGALCIGISVIFPNASNKNVINRMAYFYSLAILVFAYARLRGYRWSWRWPWSKSIETQLDVTKE